MPEEMEKVLSVVEDRSLCERGNRVYYQGRLCGVDIVAVFSRWGKVAAATTVTNLIVEFGVDRIFFTGIAGGLVEGVNIGDVVVGHHLFQHDMDARPNLRRFEIPLTGKTSFEVSPDQLELSKTAVFNFLKDHADFRRTLRDAGIESPLIHVGDIASGDLFIGSSAMRKALNRNLPSVLCADMESAAAAQVCYDYHVPFAVVRAISDQADEHAEDASGEFVIRHGGDYALGIVTEYLKLCSHGA